MPFLLLLLAKCNSSRHLLLVPIALIHWKLSCTVESFLVVTELTAIAGKIHCVLCAGGKITMKRFHVSWFLPSFHRVIFHLINIYSRMEHNTIRTASFETMWLDINHEKEIGLRPLPSDWRRKWDLCQLRQKLSAASQFLRNWVKGCLKRKLTRVKCYYLLNSIGLLRDLHQDICPQRKCRNGEKWLYG